MQKIRVLVVDDHTIVRDGIAALLGLAGDIEVVGEAINGNDALKMATKLKPDVVLMDIGMPVMGGLEATRRISKEFPKTKVLVLTQHDDKESNLQFTDHFSMLAHHTPDVSVTGIGNRKVP